jgi:ribonuclease D
VAWLKVVSRFYKQRSSFKKLLKTIVNIFEKKKVGEEEDWRKRRLEKKRLEKKIRDTALSRATGWVLF